MTKNHSSLIKEDVWLKKNEARVFLLKKKTFFLKELKIIIKKQENTLFMR